MRFDSSSSPKTPVWQDDKTQSLKRPHDKITSSESQRKLWFFWSSVSFFFFFFFFKLAMEERKPTKHRHAGAEHVLVRL